MPSTDAFDTQDKAYQDSVLTPGVKRVAIEAGVGDAWYKYVGLVQSGGHRHHLIKM
jgi:transketolase